VDAKDYAIRRIEGSPAKNPPFWTRSIHIEHRYGKAGAFWLPLSNSSSADVRIFGRTVVTIEYFDRQGRAPKCRSPNEWGAKRIGTWIAWRNCAYWFAS